MNDEFLQRLIELKNIAAVKHLRLTLPDGGGIVVLRGRNGTGKTRTLEAVESALGRKGNPPTVTDGELSGQVDVCGVTMTVARSTRLKGELEVETLEGRLSIDQVVDPGLKDAGAADARRIRALVNLVGADPDVELFHDLAGGKDSFDQIVPSERMDDCDLVTMADRIKREFDRAARDDESSADTQDGKARGLLESAASAPDCETDADKLQAELETAIGNDVAIRQRQTVYLEWYKARRKSQKRFEKIDYAGPTEPAAREAMDATLRDLATADAHVKTCIAAAEAANKAMRDAGAERDIVFAKAEAASDAHNAAASHRDMVAALKAELCNAGPVDPDTSAITAAADAITAARLAVETGAIARQARMARSKAGHHAQSALTHRRRAAKLRDAGKGIDAVLSAVVSQAASTLAVESGRLITQTSRGKTYYAELSHGERWDLVIDMAVDAVGKGGLLVIRQEAWEGLDPPTRQRIAEKAKAVGVVILTAEATDDATITSEVLQ